MSYCSVSFLAITSLETASRSMPPPSLEARVPSGFCKFYALIPCNLEGQCGMRGGRPSSDCFIRLLCSTSLSRTRDATMTIGSCMGLVLAACHSCRTWVDTKRLLAISRNIAAIAVTVMLDEAPQAMFSFSTRHCYSTRQERKDLQCPRNILKILLNFGRVVFCAGLCANDPAPVVLGSIKHQLHPVAPFGKCEFRLSLQPGGSVSAHLGNRPSRLSVYSYLPTGSFSGGHKHKFCRA